MTSDSGGGDETNYAAIECPPSISEATEPVEKWHWTKRRAFIRQLIISYGSPEALPPQRRLADRLAVDQSTISRDITAVAESAMQDVDADRVAWTITQTYRTALCEQQRAGDHAAAVRTADSYASWAEKAGLITTTPDEHRVVSDQRVSVTDADDDGPRGHLTEQSAAHFDRLLRDAERTTAPNTVSTESRADEGATGTQNASTDTTEERPE